MTAATEFEPATGEMGGLPTNKRHLNVKWAGGNVWFSLTRKGQALSVHLACQKSDLRKLETAAECFCDWCFAAYPWCRMILAAIKRPSVVKLAKRCGFTPIASRGGTTIMMRVRDGRST